MAAKRRAETMEENRIKLIGAARKAFAASGFAAASMDDLTAQVGLTRGALYHGFGDKKGLLAAVVAQVDGEMAARARQAGATAADPWERLLAEGVAYIGMALDPEVRRIVLLDGPAFLGDPSRWPSQNACLSITKQTVADLIAEGVMKPVDIEAAVTPSERHGIQCRSMDCRQRRAAHRLAEGDRGVPADGRRISGESRLTVIRQSIADLPFQCDNGNC